MKLDLLYEIDAPKPWTDGDEQRVFGSDDLGGQCMAVVVVGHGGLQE